MNDNWKEIASILKEDTASQLSPEELRLEVEGCFRMLGWRKFNSSIKFIFNKNNSCQDIALCTKELTKDVICLIVNIDSSKSNEERENDLGETMLSQNCKQGILIGDKMRLYCIDSLCHKPVCILSIPYLEDNEQGSKLCDLLTYPTFNLVTFQKFCDELFQKIPARGNLRRRIIAIISDESKLSEVFKEYLIKEGYSKEDVEEEFSDLHIDATFIGKSYSADTKRNHSEKEDGESTRDTTKFSMDGKNYYPKKVFVLKLIQRYVAEHPDITFDELNRQFPPEILSKKRGVVKQLSIVQDWIQSNPDLRKRYCLKPDEIITLKGGMKVVVHNQWGKRFPRFLEVAKTLYHITSDGPYCGLEEKKNDIDDVASEPQPSGIQISAEALKSFQKR